MPYSQPYKLKLVLNITVIDATFPISTMLFSNRLRNYFKNENSEFRFLGNSASVTKFMMKEDS